MADRYPGTGPKITPAQIMVTYLDDCEDELLDAVVTAAALVARADGRIEFVELDRLVDFLGRHRLLSAFMRVEVPDAFRRRLRELAEPRGSEAAIDSLRQVRHSLSRLVIEAGEEVSAADGYVDSYEQQVLQLIRSAFAEAR